MKQCCNINRWMIYSVIIAAFFVLTGCFTGSQPTGHLNTVSTFDTSTSTLPRADASDASSYYHYLNGRLAMKKGNLEKALHHFGKAAALDPDSVTIAKDYASILIQKKQFGKAADYLVTTLENKPDNPVLLTMLAQLRLVMKEEDKAAIIYSRLIDMKPADRKLFFVLAGLYTEQKEYDKAIAVFQRLIEKEPDFFGGYYYLGLLHKKKGELTLSRQALKKSLEMEPDFNAGRFELIDIYSKDQNLEKTIDACQAILSKDPDNVRARLYLAIAYLSAPATKQKGADILAEYGRDVSSKPDILNVVLRYFISPQNYSDAVMILRGMLETAPENANLLYYTAAAYEGMKQDALSIDYLKRIAPDSVYFEEASLHIALYYYYKNQLTPAIDTLRAALQHKPNNNAMIHHLATFLKETGAFESSEAVLLQGISNDLTNTQFLYSLGVLYDKWGKKDKSQATMKRVLEIDPEDANAMNYLGYTYADMGTNFHEAERLIRKALEYKPGDGYITDSLGWLFYKKGDFKKALQLLNEAVSKVPDDPVLLEHLGDALVKNNKQGKALEVYRKSMQFQEDDTSLLEMKINDLLKKLSCDS